MSDDGSFEAKKLMIILSKGSIDSVIPALILASTAATLGMEVGIFFTFWSLPLLKKGVGLHKAKLSPIGNPAMGIPNILAVLPGMTSMATSMIKKKMKSVGMMSVEELVKACKEAGVKFYACSATAELLGLKKEDLIPEVDDVVGATTFLLMAKEDSIVLFI